MRRKLIEPRRRRAEDTRETLNCVNIGLITSRLYRAAVILSRTQSKDFDAAIIHRTGINPTKKKRKRKKRQVIANGIKRRNYFTKFRSIYLSKK